MDTDKNGYLDKNEFQIALKHFDSNIDDSQVQEVSQFMFCLFCIR